LVTTLKNKLDEGDRELNIKGLASSLSSVVVAALNKVRSGNYICILNDKESAAYFMNDLEQILGETDYELSRKKVLLFPAGHKRHYDDTASDNDSILLRTEVLKRLSSGSKNLLIITFPY